MKKLFAGSIILILLGAGCAPSPAPAVPAPAAAANVNVKAPETAAQPAIDNKFVDQSYYKNAYLISGAEMDAKTKEAITGFDIVKKALAGGATQYDLKALKSEYKDQTYIIKPGEKLYFIETFMGDDDVNEDLEKGFRDDMAVVVDANGNVIGEPAPWTK